MTGYEKLKVWKMSIELVTDVYKLVKFLPKEETYIKKMLNALITSIKRTI